MNEESLTEMMDPTAEAALFSWGGRAQWTKPGENTVNGYGADAADYLLPPWPGGNN